MTLDATAPNGCRQPVYNRAAMRPWIIYSQPRRALSGHRARTAAVAVAAALTLSGCGTVALGARQPYGIDSEPPGATALLSDGSRCTTPCELRLRRKVSLRVMLYKDCHEPAELEIGTRLSNPGKRFTAFNMVMIGGFFMAAVDKLSGALMELTPPVRSGATLTPQAEGRCEPLRLRHPPPPDPEPREARHCCGPRHRI